MNIYCAYFSFLFFKKNNCCIQCGCYLTTSNPMRSWLYMLKPLSPPTPYLLFCLAYIICFNIIKAERLIVEPLFTWEVLRGSYVLGRYVQMHCAQKTFRPRLGNRRPTFTK